MKLAVSHVTPHCLPAPPRGESIISDRALCAPVHQRESVCPLCEAQLEVKRCRSLQHLVCGRLLVLRARPRPLRPCIRRQRLLLGLGCLRHGSCRRGGRRRRLLRLRLRVSVLKRRDTRELREVQRVAARRVGEREVPKAQRVCDLVRVRVRV